MIYLITNNITGKQYVGQTTRKAERRFLDHCTEKRNRHISNAIKKYGKENFTLTKLVSVFSLKELNDMEAYFVKFFNTIHPHGYNHRAGGNQNGICSKELKKKISKAKTGVPNYKRRGVPVSKKQRLDISRTLGGQEIIAVHSITGEVKVYETVHSTKKDGHNPSNIVTICKKHTGRRQSKNWFFYYKSDYVNQSGSLEIKKSKHAQRLDLEPVDNKQNKIDPRGSDKSIKDLKR